MAPKIMHVILSNKQMSGNDPCIYIWKYFPTILAKYQFSFSYACRLITNFPKIYSKCQMASCASLKDP